MAFPTTFTHIYTQTVSAPEGILQDDGQAYTGDTVVGGYWTVNANGGGANAITLAFPATGFQSMLLFSTVPCVVTLTGVTVINGVTIGTVTLAANTLVHVTSITGACTAISIGANTTGAGPAGKLSCSVLYNS